MALKPTYGLPLLAGRAIASKETHDAEINRVIGDVWDAAVVAQLGTPEAEALVGEMLAVKAGTVADAAQTGGDRVAVEAARAAAESAVLADYKRATLAELPTTGVATNATAWVSGTGHFYHWDGEDWIDDGEGILASKAAAADLEDLVGQVGGITFDAISNAHGLAFVVTDEDGNASPQLQLNAEGKFTESAAESIAETLKPYVKLDALAVESLPEGVFVAFVVQDSEGNSSDLELDQSGEFTPRVRRKIAAYVAAESESSEIRDPWSAPPARLVTIGDSLTAGAGATGSSQWRNVLTGLTGIPHDSMGVGGEGARTIVARTGAQPFKITFEDGEIPSATDPVTVTLTTYDGKTTAPLMQGGAGINPVTVRGISGTLSRNSSTGVYSFARSVAGDAVPLAFPEFLRTHAYDAYRASLPIIGIGQNGGFDDEDDLIRMYWSMILWSTQGRADRYLVWSAPSGTAASRAALEARFLREFGHHYVNVRERLSSIWALSVNGITATAQDTSDIAVGSIPQSLRSDSTHHNSAGQYALALCFYQAGQHLSYWS